MKEYWLALSRALYLTHREKYNLINVYGNAERLFNAASNEIISTGIVKPWKVTKLMKEGTDSEDIKILDSKGIELCPITDSRYPEVLKNIYDPPVVLYYKGEFPSGTCIGVVGSRMCTDWGSRRAAEISCRLAGKGFWVISGLAKGIDAKAHEGALAVGKTAAVLGNGLDICYPKENKALYERIGERGCLISELPPDMKPTRYTFPARNRIISGMSEAVIVVEAAKKSGALITAEFALEHGKEIFAFEGGRGTMSEGTNDLIRDGAIPINSIEEFMDIYT